MSDPIIIVNDPQPERKKLRWRQWITKFKAHGAFCHYCKIPLLFKHAVREHMTPICRGRSGLYQQHRSSLRALQWNESMANGRRIHAQPSGATAEIHSQPRYR